jgi:hypothetical protein
VTISNRAGHRKVPGPVSFVDEERAMKKVPSTKFGVSEWPQVFNLRSATLVAAESGRRFSTCGARRWSQFLCRLKTCTHFGKPAHAVQCEPPAIPALAARTCP